MVSASLFLADANKDAGASPSHVWFSQAVSRLAGIARGSSVVPMTAGGLLGFPAGWMESWTMLVLAIPPLSGGCNWCRNPFRASWSFHWAIWTSPTDLSLGGCERDVSIDAQRGSVLNKLFPLRTQSLSKPRYRAAN